MSDARPHLPAWLGDAVSVVVSKTNAEGVALVGSQARGDAAAASDYDLLLIADDEQVARLAWPLTVRWEPLEGFARPLEFLAATMAEVMAGLYCGHPQWLQVTAHMVPLYDPHGFVRKISERAGPVPEGWFAAQLAFLRRAVLQAEVLVNERPAEAALVIARAELSLLDAVRRAASLGTMRDSDVLAWLAEHATPAALYADQAILSQSVASRVNALARMIDGVESGLR